MIEITHPNERDYSDYLELGDRVVGALYRENTGPWWARYMIVAVRAE